MYNIFVICLSSMCRCIPVQCIVYVCVPCAGDIIHVAISIDVGVCTYIIVLTAMCVHMLCM